MCSKRNVRKEDLIEAVLARRGRHPGLVAIFPTVEARATYQPWHDKQTGQTYLRPDDGKCLHYYFYFIDDELGLTYTSEQAERREAGFDPGRQFPRRRPAAGPIFEVKAHFIVEARKKSRLGTTQN
jgi:hypothetical protein